VPSVHVRPEQQSAVVVQVSLPERHWQRLPTQYIWPQQSDDVEQVAPLSTQHSEVLGLARQLSPSQHEEAPLHSVPAVEHVVLLASQVPAEQVRPPRQIPPKQHSSPSLTPQPGSSQLPALQSSRHSRPHSPQLRESSVVSTQVFPQHVSVPEHSASAQHSWPAPPHVAAIVVQTPAVQLSPPSHVVPPQQGSRGPPQTVASWHMPLTHARPDAQRSPQHGRRAPPQVVGAEQVPVVWQTRPDSQTRPVQHGSVVEPQAPPGVQREERQTRPASHASPVQQPWSIRPHDESEPHVPARQVRPGSQSDPRQQGVRLEPHANSGLPPSRRRPASIAAGGMPPSRARVGDESQPPRTAVAAANVRAARRQAKAARIGGGYATCGRTSFSHLHGM
jgi:hypothetical protein